MSEAVLTRRSVSGEGNYELLADIEINAATTQVDITGLNICKGDRIVVVTDIRDATGSATRIYLYSNGDMNGANYRSQYVGAYSAYQMAARLDLPYFSYCAQGVSTLTFGVIELLESGRMMFQTRTVQKYDDDDIYEIKVFDHCGFSEVAVDAITLLTFKAAVANAIAPASRIQLYKGGE